MASGSVDRVLSRYHQAATGEPPPRLLSVVRRFLPGHPAYKYSLSSPEAPHAFTYKADSRFTLSIDGIKAMARNGLVQMRVAEVGHITLEFANPKGSEAPVSTEAVDPASGKTLSGGAAARQMLDAFDELKRKGGSRFYVALVDLREALPLSRAAFDRTIDTLRRDWILTLSPAEGRHETVPQRILDAGIMEHNRLLVYADRREE